MTDLVNNFLPPDPDGKEYARQWRRETLTLKQSEVARKKEHLSALRRERITGDPAVDATRLESCELFEEAAQKRSRDALDMILNTEVQNKLNTLLASGKLEGLLRERRNLDGLLDARQAAEMLRPQEHWWEGTMVFKGVTYEVKCLRTQFRGDTSFAGFTKGGIRFIGAAGRKVKKGVNFVDDQTIKATMAADGHALAMEMGPKMGASNVHQLFLDAGIHQDTVDNLECIGGSKGVICAAGRTGDEPDHNGTVANKA